MRVSLGRCVPVCSKCQQARLSIIADSKQKMPTDLASEMTQKYTGDQANKWVDQNANYSTSGSRRRLAIAEE
ncbi:hypothetical protein SBA5_170006 [Candidatus Sulfotelmatomonas gaucii]|uniref:Uncharacterized protein n=1 Tax=Candidatus Sulfuritelmatomonas gaucii TaxID=2043161 RepID=A0A2N9L6R6_9BACT|nr:hypothetical protein SBA5_170006 [Candidatus Sulfotelmatomonas gaucii]